MTQAMRTIVLLTWVLEVAFVFSIPLKQFDILKRHPRSAEDGKLGCVHMEFFPGDYYYVSDGNSDVCGLYLIGLPDQLVEIEFKEFNIDCDSGALLAIVDGWELNEEFFPSAEDHGGNFEDRYQTFCGMQRPSKMYMASQNVALIQFIIPVEHEGFRISVRFVENPQPCNAVSMMEEGILTLKNYGEKRNCSVSIIYPEKIQLVSVDVGVTSENTPFETEVGVSNKCFKSSGSDYAELRTGDGMDPSTMKPRAHFCGLESRSGNKGIVLGCQHSVIRLVSTGQYYNTVSFIYLPPGEGEITARDVASC